MNNQITQILFKDIVYIIEKGKQQAVAQVNSMLTLTYWHIGNKINDHILKNERAEYGEKIIENIASALEKEYGRSYSLRNVRRMMQFADIFPNYQIVTPLVTQLSWSHFLLLLPLKGEDQRNFYIQKIREEKWSKRALQYQIERKAFERNELASLQLTDNFSEIQNTFKDPYFLDFLGLKDGYLENDLESAIIKELEFFILELGKGFAFIERQKRMIIDGEDFYLDLLFFHRKLQRLVAIELKLGKFKSAYKGQMELYLKWLDKYERQENENSPIGLILCAGKSNEQVELLDMQKDGIMVADYWTELPPKKELERKLHTLLLDAKSRLENKKI
ncbi:hypothetical protein PBAC_32530 [Pedobacter glucosidilyticus]|uniref:DUF1016 domain-containing protein n=1 Tax=Pedobacter aquae TaxID=2605747 RepID=A0A5C0VIC0_9SPHI|nr:MULTISPECIES: PDDEXK nuclease domain-containing protein [Pedobacter]KHJ36570.1 hypothetical protein PBAC_32530 [Pedobacter glucosidilyticus]QEK52468.1 DUF1016 domain-containing protein [Pedobacter aquae]